MNYQDPLAQGGVDDRSKLDPSKSDSDARKALGAQGLLMVPYSQMHQLIEARVKDELGGFHWVVSLHQQPVYILTIPE